MTAAFFFPRSLTATILGGIAWLVSLSPARGETDPKPLTPEEENLARFARGVLAEVEGDLPTARKHVEASLQADPSSFSLARKTAGLQSQDDDLRAAVTTLRTFADVQPQRLDAQLYFADFLKAHIARDDAGAQQAAQQILERANANFPNQSGVFSRLIRLYEYQGKREDSLTLYRDQFEVKQPGLAHWMALEALTRTLLPEDSPELDERLERIAKEIRATGLDHELATRQLSDYYRRTNRLAEALAVLSEHVERHPDSLTLRTRLGLLQFYAKDHEAALLTLEDVLLIDPDQLLAHRSLARYHEREENAEKALHHNAEILRITGGSAQEFLEVAEQYLALDQARSARLLLEKARFNHPSHPALAARLAIATLRDGSPTLAARLFREAEALAEEAGELDTAPYLDADFQLEFASSLKDARDDEEAENRLRKAIRRMKADQPQRKAQGLRMLATLWIEQDRNLGPARSLLQQAAALDPDNKDTRKLLERLKKK